MVWRYAYCFLRILKLFFLHFNLDIFSSLYATDMYREYMPCIGNPAYSFRPILLKLYRYFAAFLWFHMRNLSLAGYNCSGGASCMACSFIDIWIIIWSNSASYSLQIFIFNFQLLFWVIQLNDYISKVGTQIQIRMGVGSATFPIMGPMRGQYVFLMKKIYIFYAFPSFDIIILGNWASFY